MKPRSRPPTPVKLTPRASAASAAALSAPKSELILEPAEVLPQGSSRSRSGSQRERVPPTRAKSAHNQFETPPNPADPWADVSRAELAPDVDFKYVLLGRKVGLVQADFHLDSLVCLFTIDLHNCLDSLGRASTWDRDYKTLFKRYERRAVAINGYC